MNVILYTKDNCSFCVSAKMLLANKGIPYTEQKLGQDFTRDTLLEMFPNARTYPVVVIDGFNIGGFDQLKEQLNNSGDSKKLLTEGV